MFYVLDAVFRTQHRTPAVGPEQIEPAHEEIFGMIRLDIGLEIDDVVVPPTVSYARTRSALTATFLPENAHAPGPNQELSALARDHDSSNRRIGRSTSSTTQPRAHG